MRRSVILNPGGAAIVDNLPPSARLAWDAGSKFKSRRDVHTVMRLDNHVADIDAHTESNAPILHIADCKFLDAGLELQRGRTASTALGNSAKNPSPVFFTMRPSCSGIAGATAFVRSVVSLACVASSSLCISRE